MTNFFIAFDILLLGFIVIIIFAICFTLAVQMTKILCQKFELASEVSSEVSSSVKIVQTQKNKVFEDKEKAKLIIEAVLKEYIKEKN